MRLWGSEMFYGHLLSGPAGAVPSYLSSPTGGTGASPAIAQGPSYKTIERHEPVMLDYVFAYNGYLSDHTRIYSLGALPAEFVRAYPDKLIGFLSVHPHDPGYLDEMERCGDRSLAGWRHG